MFFSREAAFLYFLYIGGKAVFHHGSHVGEMLYELRLKIGEKRKHILDTMIKDAGMRGKAKLIDGFIQKNVDEDKENFMNGRNRADGTNELEERLNQYIVSERNKAVSDLANDEQISAEVLNLYIKEYDYLQKEQPEIIQKALKEKHLGLIKTRKALTRIMERLRSIIKTFNWE